MEKVALPYKATHADGTVTYFLISY